MAKVPEKFEDVAAEKEWWRTLIQGKVVTEIFVNSKNNIVGLELDGVPIYLGVGGNGHLGTLLVTTDDDSEIRHLSLEELDQFSKEPRSHAKKPPLQMEGPSYAQRPRNKAKPAPAPSLIDKALSQVKDVLLPPDLPPEKKDA